VGFSYCLENERLENDRNGGGLETLIDESKG